MRGQGYHPVGGDLVHEQVLLDEEGGEHLLHLDGDGGEQLLPIDVENPGGVLADGLDKYGEGKEEGEGAGRGGGSLKLQLPLVEMLCGLQLEPCHDLSAWLLSSSCVGLGGGHGGGWDHGGHGDGYLV